MEFGAVTVGEAAGAVLAHSVALPGGKLKKGTVLNTDHVAALGAAGIARVTVARLGPGDLGEDEAAMTLAHALVDGGEGLRLSKPFTGRVNIHATRIGLAHLDADRLHAVNAVDDMVTLATVPNWRRMGEGGMVATVKVIAYGAARASVDKAAALGRGAVRLAPVVTPDATLIVTTHDAGSGEETGKGFKAIEGRLTSLGMTLADTVQVPHEAQAVADAIRGVKTAMILVLTASATSDPADVGPEALRQAGGQVTRFGMPVDPGNLLFYGALGDGRPVIGLPGCARSPAMNGADWVLERLAAGHPPTSAEVGAMGVGGLLKEIPTRKQPRGG
ncbi:molybdenum cofactor cytidylyltransferase [Maritimibacter alkaliphilus HTCC2654]|uniref:Molybdopterin biosynthesis protein n=1 Tax=Maritimibacter alkaliphilus HTCC2654 TaxID=314271 RepID=A3VKH5_9RHOB|nr:molybdopterin-binding protein [Maritimibacter alkaliphilus]EAQ11299.1 molybdopterin biosynthesis protein [Maritimibacter alkaliphilus HTCC2654]TYP81518.1 molybdenum cofactor cytidylyltransferase [Maritimibacter alkaliphilus HTCC2654]